MIRWEHGNVTLLPFSVNYERTTNQQTDMRVHREATLLMNEKCVRYGGYPSKVHPVQAVPGPRGRGADPVGRPREPSHPGLRRQVCQVPKFRFAVT